MKVNPPFIRVWGVSPNSIILHGLKRPGLITSVPFLSSAALPPLLLRVAQFLASALWFRDPIATPHPPSKACDSLASHPAHRARVPFAALPPPLSPMFDDSSLR